MLKIRHQRILSIVIFLGLGLAIGCGDGSKHKSRVARSGTGGANALNGKNGRIGGKVPAIGQGGAGTGTPAGTDGTGTGTGSGTGGTKTPADIPTPSDSAETKATMKKISDAVTAATGGQALAISAVDAGTYTLDKIVTHFKYVAANTALGGGETYVESLWQGGNLTPTQSKYGIMNSDVPDEGRLVQVPVAFDVAQPWTPTALGNDFMFSMQTTIDDKGGLSPKDGADPKQKTPVAAGDVSLMELLAGQTTDKNGKTLKTSVVKTEDGIRVVVTIDEKIISADVAAADKKTSKQGSMFRDMIFFYKFAPATPKP